LQWQPVPIKFVVFVIIKVIYLQESATVLPPPMTFDGLWLNP